MGDTALLYKIVVSSAVLVGAVVLSLLLGATVRKYAKRYGVEPQRSVLVGKLLRALVLVLAAVALGLIWGIDVQNVYVVVTGVLGLIAIGLVAVWSILSNVLSGVILFFARPFSIDDEIVLVPDDVRGRVADIGLMFVTLEDAAGDHFSVPNNLFFQRAIRTVRRKGPPPAEGSES